MSLRIKILAGLLPVAAILLLSALLFCCCLRRRRRHRHQLNPAASSQLAEAAASKSPKLPKLHVPSQSRSSRASLRFHHLHEHRSLPRPHQENSATDLQQQQQQPPFRWDEHPRLVADAAENGWSRFVFAPAAHDRADWPESTWEVPPGSSEFVQTVRLNPAIRKKKKSGGDNGADCSACASSLRMSLPLPGPQLPGSPFPQEAYFEITILYLDSQSRYSPSSRADKRSTDHSDKAKLIRQTSAADESDSVAMYHHNSRGGGGGGGIEYKEFEAEQRKHNKPMVVSLGLSICYSPTVNSLPGTYPRSVGFHSDGAVYLDGMKLVTESEKSKWAGVNRVIGCGFEPSKKKVFFTVDSQLKHAISCNSDAFASPLYPVLATDVDVMVSVNLGQSKFRYSPANARRTANPCFVGSNSGDEGSMANGYEDSGELFSMGRVDSGWLDNAKNRSQKSTTADGGGAAVDFDAESDLFEISLKD